MKKVLIVSYYWPPAGGPGVQRWLKFVKYLPENGIQPVVYVPEKAHYPLEDPSLVREVPGSAEILKGAIVEPYGLAQWFSPRRTREISSGIITAEDKQGLLEKIMLFIRGNLFIPDARRFWVKPSVTRLEQYLRKNAIDTLITTGPPHSIHLIGLELRKRLGIRWIADFRDPWTQIGYHHKLRLLPWSRRKHEQLEQNVLDQADHLLVTSFTTAEEFRGKTTTPVKVITNGYDTASSAPVSLDKTFSISHIGSLLEGRNPQNLWEALGEILYENEDFSKDFQLQLAGAVGDSVLQSIRSFGLESHVHIHGYVSHEQAVKLQKEAQLLLLIEIDSSRTRGIIPGKLFEYMASERPILAVGPARWDVQRIIQETRAGRFFLYQEKDAIKQYLLEAYGKFRTGTLNSEPTGLEKYSRSKLTEQLAELLKKPV